MSKVPVTQAPSASSQSPPTIVVSGEGERHAMSGSLVIATLTTARNSLKDWPQRGASSTLDVSGITQLDTPGALFLSALRDLGVALSGIRPEHQTLFDLIGSLELKPLPVLPSVPRWRQLVTALGKRAHDLRREAVSLITFIGCVASWIVDAARHPATLRPASISRHVRETGIQALPIIALMAVMIAIVIGYQGVAQLRKYGGEDLTINLVAVSVLREMGVLITSIMVAGRSGSAYTAEIGVMKTRDEVDALTVMGLEPMQMLVVPRVIALVLILPVLTFFADIMGLAGGTAIAQVLLHMSPAQYLSRLPQVVSLSDLMVGLFKAPVFAFCIAAIACMHGLRVSGSAESVGRETTRSVVKSIFLVLVLDALFSILFERLDV
jgi:phospholipid/cholesterol/gamma-HCH transport system permease protein